MSISVLSDLSFQREILPLAPLETTFLCTFLSASFHPFRVLLHLLIRQVWEATTNMLLPGIFVKDFILLHYKRDVSASTHSKGKICIVFCGDEHALASQHHYWAQKGKTRGRNGSENGKGKKAEGKKKVFWTAKHNPRLLHMCIPSFLLIFLPKAQLSPGSSLTLLWAQIADPRSFQVPPRRSMRSIRRIWRKRRLLRDVARTLPWFPTATTGTEAISTKISARQKEQSLPTKVAPSPAP